jgi:hypothetical protein
MLRGLEAQKEQELCEDQRRAACYLDCCYIFWVVLRHRKNRSCVRITKRGMLLELLLHMLGGLGAQKEQELFEDQRRAAC